MDKRVNIDMSERMGVRERENREEDMERGEAKGEGREGEREKKKCRNDMKY